MCLLRYPSHSPTSCRHFWLASIFGLPAPCTLCALFHLPQESYAAGTTGTHAGSDAICRSMVGKLRKVQDHDGGRSPKHDAGAPPPHTLAVPSLPFFPLILHFVACGASSRKSVSILRPKLWPGHHCSVVSCPHASNLFHASSRREPPTPTKTAHQPKTSMYCPLQGTGVHLCAGMVAGAAASVVTNPIDTVKVRLQTKIADKGGAWMTFRYSPGTPHPRSPSLLHTSHLDYSQE
jgi:hypothetical protein